MAPQRKNANNDDSNSYGTESKKDKTPSSTGAGISKSKKSAGGSALKDVTNASAVGGKDDSTTTGQTSEPGDSINFRELPRRFLHSYRNAHHLPIPSSFKTIHNQAVLSDPTSIGLQSPTMSRAKEKRRVSKEALARAVRRDFMDQSVNELDVEASACYIVRNGERAFRMRFVPHTKK